MNEFIRKLYSLLVLFLGESKSGFKEDSFQYQFPCPRCIDDKGERERGKYNLEVNFVKNGGIFQCWSCAQVHDEMKGSVLKLIKMYGNSEILNEYISVIKDFRQSKLYELHFANDEFNFNTSSFVTDDLKMPSIAHKFKQNGVYPTKAMAYLMSRGIDWDIIKEYNIGYTEFDINQKELSTRIILPSHDEYGDLNYWTGREYTGFKGKQKYYNPQVERKNIIFNEDKIQWDCDITLCEGPFDHIVIPNSIPLLGKALHEDFKIYQSVMRKANANVNIFLDGDAFEDVKKIYKLLNHGRLQDKIRYIPVNETLDPSEIFEKYGRKGIIEHLKMASKIKNVYLS